MEILARFLLVSKAHVLPLWNTISGGGYLGQFGQDVGKHVFDDAVTQRELELQADRMLKDLRRKSVTSLG